MLLVFGAMTISVALPVACSGSSADTTAEDAGQESGVTNFDAREIVDAGPDSNPCLPYDTNTFQRTACACDPIAEFCSDPVYQPFYGPRDLCELKLSQADDAATWGGTGNCGLLQSSNTCAGDTQVILGGGTDFWDELFYDGTGKLVGALRVINAPEKCWGVIPPLDCLFAGNSDGGTCCDWSPQILFDTLDAGVCYPANGAGAADAGDD